MASDDGPLESRHDRCGLSHRQHPVFSGLLITNAAKKKIPIESIKRVTGQRSSGIVLDYVAAATLDDEPPLLEIIK